MTTSTLQTRLVQLNRPHVPTPAPAATCKDSLQVATCPTLPFVHAGVEYTLNKHPSVQQALRASRMTIAQALTKNWYLRKEIDGADRLFSCKTANDKEAIRAAKDMLNGRVQHPSQFAEFMAQRAAKRVPQPKLSELVTAYQASPVEASATTRQHNVNALFNILTRATGQTREDLGKLPISQLLTPDTVKNFFDPIAKADFPDQSAEATAKRSANSLWRQAVSVCAPKAKAYYRSQKCYHATLEEFEAAGLLHSFTRVPKIEYNPPSDAIIQATFTAWLSLEDRNVFLAIGHELAFGLRIGEVAQVRTSWWTTRESYPVLDGAGDFKNGTGAVQVRALDPWFTLMRAKALSRGWLDFTQDTLIITGSDSYRADAIEREVSAFLRSLGWQTTKTNHALRAYAGSQIAMKYGIYDAQTWLRHSSVKVTEGHYSHFVCKFKPTDMDRIPARWAVSTPVSRLPEVENQANPQIPTDS